MAESELRLVKRCTGFLATDRVEFFPRSRRGIYVLYRHRRRNGKDRYDVVYVGMARAGMRSRLRSHLKKKGDLWTHHLYRRDTRANILNIQRGFKKVRQITINNFERWT